ncbi:methyl-accepting chemotaxis protein [Thiomicrorhabdus sediminis]|uniref:HAMP domain-containing protein n=1 Tax=Thiomicrorhabdus sediminis TaxID=2580412 RepID=A0A4P9K5E1_9GAMM|nr:methyl-accepting chemotaxis protein [Thiomicrorhabdus sediminis]QCU90215.1 HAMP domain-containing protein [Thiomicrorhabdus sediminis]
MFRNASLRAKVIFSTALTGLITATILGIVIYNTSIVPIKQIERDRVIDQMSDYINAQINLKVQGGILGSTALSTEPVVVSSLEVEEREVVIPTLAKLKEQFANQTGYKSIRSHLITMDGRSLVRSWDINNYGQDVTNNPIVKKVMKEKQAYGALAVGGVGVAVMAISPVMADGEFMGMVSFLQGLASVRKAFTADMEGQWIMLVDKEQLTKQYGDLEVVSKNMPINNKYILSNNRWFDKDAVEFLKRAFQPIDGEERQVYSFEDKTLIDIPAYDADNQIFGRHIFIIDKNKYEAPINAAMESAQISLAGIILVIILLTAIIVVLVNRMIICPLQKVQANTAKILETGDFSLRNEVMSKDEVGQTSEAINNLLEQISSALDEANSTVYAISQGNFDSRIQGDYHGDLQKLKDGINDSTETIEEVMNSLSSAMQAMREGNYSTTISSANTAGRYKDMLENAKQAFSETNQVIQEINNVMQSMQQGNYSKRVEIIAQGDLKTLKYSINDSMESLNSAINDIVSAVTSLSEGDLTKTITNEYHGDLLTLKEAINQSITNLADIVSKVVEAGVIVNNESSNVSGGANDVRQKIQQQAAAIEQTSATMEEMNAAVQNNTENAMQASEVVEQVQGESGKAQDVMTRTIEAMDSIQASSSEIAEIVTLIDSIAFQTNLLALNAAVEAARAGEHGRGFAVVAGEVRSLAQKSADAAKDIKNLIDSSVQRISQGTELARASGEVQKEIMVSINNVAEMIHQINAASQEQAEGVSQVHQAISEIDSATQANAALVESTSSSADNMSSQAASLNEYMSFFKTGKSVTQAKPLAAPQKPVAPAAEKPKAADKVETPKLTTKPVVNAATDKATAAKPAESKTQAKPSTAKPDGLQTPAPTQPTGNDDEWAEF